MVEGFLTAAFKAAGHDIKTPFPRMDYDDAIRQFGIDKPDLRLPAFTEVRDCFSPADLEQLAINKDLPVVAIRMPKSASSRAKSATTSSRCSSRKGGARFSKTSSASRTSSPMRPRRFARNLAPAPTT